jgi:hypothetical protein
MIDRKLSNAILLTTGVIIVRHAKKLARATLSLMEGTMLLVLIHNDPSYASTAEMAAIALVEEKF